MDTRVRVLSHTGDCARKGQVGMKPSGRSGWKGWRKATRGHQPMLLLLQGGPLGVLPGHLADHLQRAGAPP